MAQNEKMTERVREALNHLKNVEEKKMFRGVTFMVNGNLCLTTGDQRLLCRVDPSLNDELLQSKRCEVMVMKNKAYRGYLFIHEDDIKTKKEFDFWINLALVYNKKLKSKITRIK